MNRPRWTPPLMARVLGVVLAATLAPAATPALAAPTAPAAAVDAPSSGSAGRASSVTLTGNGYGHGRGLSQWGAKYAADQGLSYSQILEFYYPGLKTGRLGGTVSVLISADTSTDVEVRDRTGLTVTSLANRRTYPLTKRAARWWRITPTQQGSASTISVRSRGSRAWQPVRTVPGDAQFSAGNKPLTLRTPSGTRAYRGALRSAGPAGSPTQRDTVNVVALEDYLRGVVPREVPAEWPQQAVRAQAVAARTYAAFEQRSPLAGHYEICDTTQCQVYGGYTDEHPASDAAVEATSKQVLLTGGVPAFAQFSASNGGFTTGGTVSYLPAKKDPYDVAYRGWRATITDAAVRAALPGVGALQSIEVVARDGNGAFGGRATQVRVVGSNGSSTLSGDTFRSYFGLRSTMFKVD